MPYMNNASFLRAGSSAFHRCSPVSQSKLCIALAVAQGIVFSPLVSAPSQNDRMQQNEIQQKELQDDTQKLVAQLDAMIEAYHRNGLGGDDLKSLEALHSVLKNLSDADMKKVIQSLQQAQALDNPKAAFQLIANAYSGQKGISVRLKQLIAGYQRIQTALDVSDEISKLADRQATNLRNGVILAQFTGNKKPEEYDESTKASIEAQQSEQKAIGDELKIAGAKVEALAKDADDKEMADSLNQGVAQVAELIPNLDAASASLQQSQFTQAATQEKTARDQLRRLARTIAPNKDTLELLRDAEEKITRMIEDEKDIIKRTGKLPGADLAAYIDHEMHRPYQEDPFFPKWLGAEKLWPTELCPSDAVVQKMQSSGIKVEPISALKDEPHVIKFFEQVRNEAAAQFAGLESRQADLQDQDDLLAQDLQKDSKGTSEALNAAMQNMQEARAGLVTKEPAPSVTGEQAALANLQIALEKLKKDLELAELQEDTSADPITKLQELEKQTSELMTQQTEENNAAKTPDQAAANTEKQEDIKRKTEKVESQATEASPDAAKDLQDAAHDMQKAEDTQKNAATAPQASTPEQSALTNLTKADDQLKKEIAKLQQTQKDLAEEEKAAKELEKIIADQEKLQLDTGTDSAQLPKLADAVKALSPKQGDIQNDTDKFVKDLTAPVDGTPPPPSDELNGVVAAATSAENHMASAKGLLAQADGKAAGPAEQDALTDLYKAQDLLKKKMEEDETALNQDSTSADTKAMADADTQIEQADKELQNAQDAMNGEKDSGSDADAKTNAELGTKAEKDMSNAANDTAPSAANSDLPDAVQAALRGANQMSATGAAQAAAGEKGNAQASAAAARAMLAQARQAIAQAEGGVSPSGPPGPPSAIPGSDPGTQVGKSAKPAQGVPLQKGSNHVALTKSSFQGLPKRDRDAIEQSQAEKYPPEYAGQIEQYMQNLATQSGK